MATILLLNGDDSTAALLTEFFEWQGHRALRAPTVADARAHIEATAIDLVVTERIVPWPDGVCVPTVLGPTCQITGVPMLVWTADVLQEDRSCILSAGARYLPKPSSLTEIGGAVRELLQARRPEPA